MFPLLALMLSADPAHAGEIVVSATGGRDFPTDQFYTGLQGSILPDWVDTWGGIGRLAAVWGFADDFPLFQLEAGFVGAIPHDGEIVRLGVVASAELVATHYRLPVEFSEKDRHIGIIPGVELLVEFEFFHERPFVFGARGGIQSASSNYLCPTPDDVEDCLAWFPAFVGGFYGRGMITKWLYLEGLIGPSPRISIGYPFPVGKRRGQPTPPKPAPTPTEPTPVPTEPVPTEPVPTEPAPTESAPVPTEPAPGPAPLR